MTTNLDPALGADLLATELLWYRHNELLPATDNLRAALTDLSDLADSIKANGLLQPLTITHEAGRPVIVAGHRRHAAIGQLITDGAWPAGRRIQCVCAPHDLDAEERTVAMLVENLHRVDLDPIEEARGYERLRAAGWKNARIASEVGRPVDRISARCQLLRLPEKLQRAVSDGELTLALAATIAAQPEPVRDTLAKQPDVPTDYTVKTAINDHERVEAIETTRKNAAARGLDFDPSRSSWQMHNEYTSVLETTPDGLAKVLLPANQGPGWAATITGYAPHKVTVWRPDHPAGGDSEEEIELSEHDKAKAAWETEVERIDAAWRAAVKQHRADMEELRRDYALNARTATVAASAMWELVLGDVYSSIDTAEEMGAWSRPTVDDDDDSDVDLVEKAFIEWVTVPTNLTRLVAYMLTATWVEDNVPLKKDFQAHALERIGNAPARPPFPAEPADTTIGAEADAEEGGEDDE